MSTDDALCGQANTCRHDSASGVDQSCPSDPSKVWRCDHCGLKWVAGETEAWAKEWAAQVVESGAIVGIGWTTRRETAVSDVDAWNRDGYPCRLVERRVSPPLPADPQGGAV